MSRILLDTSAYSAGQRGHAGVKEILQTAEEIYLTPIVLGELQSGFAAGDQRPRNLRLLARFLDAPRVSVLPLDEETAVRYAALWLEQRKAGVPVPTNDLWIASSALQHGLRLVTADLHFASMRGLIVDSIQ